MSRVRWAGIAAAAFVACTSSADCSTEDCRFGLDSGVIVDAPASADLDGATLTVCLGDDCTDVGFWFTEGTTELSMLAAVPGAEDGDEVIVTLSQPDGDLTGTGTMASDRPNGDCGQTCTHAEVSLEAG